MNRYRARGVLLPIVLIVIGVLVLLANLQVIAPESLATLLSLWPLLLVIVGLQLIFNRALPAGTARPLGLLVAAVIVAGALAYSLLTPASSLGNKQADASAAIDGLSAATLDLDVGASQIEVKTEPLGDQLYRAHLDFPSRESAPSVTVDRASGTLRIRSQPSLASFPFFGSRFRRIEISLTDRIPWATRMGGGATNMHLDLTSLKLSRMEISGGASQIDVSLPEARGTVPIEISGGVTNLTLRTPKGTAWRVRVTGGASSLDVFGSRVGAIGSVSRESSEFATATDRYDIQVSGGASNVRLTTA